MREGKKLPRPGGEQVTSVQKRVSQPIWKTGVCLCSIRKAAQEEEFVRKGVQRICRREESKKNYDSSKGSRLPTMETPE